MSTETASGIQPQGPFTFNQAVEKAQQIAASGVPQPVAFADDSWPGKKGALYWDPNANNGAGGVILLPHDRDAIAQSTNSSVLSTGVTGGIELVNPSITPDTNNQN